MSRPHDNDHLALLAEFMAAMGQPVSQGWEDGRGFDLGRKLITEEAKELEDALLALDWSDEPDIREAVVKELEPIQARYNELIKDKAYLEKCYSEAAPRAEAIARRTLQKVMKKVGYLPVAH